MAKNENWVTMRAYVAGNSQRKEHKLPFRSSLEELMIRYRGKLGWFIYEYSIRIPHSLIHQFEDDGVWPQELEGADSPPVLLKAHDCSKSPPEEYTDRIERKQ